MGNERRRGKVLKARSGFAEVSTAEGVVRCRLRGRLKKSRKRRSDIAVIGDEVEITVFEDGEGALEEVLPRRTKLSRRHPGPGGQHREDVLVANLDQVLCVFAFGVPAFRPRLLDRLLVVAEHNGIGPVVVANKVDLLEEEAHREPFRVYERIGYPVVYASATEGTNIDTLRERLRDRISAFAGPSGAGKSHLINAIEPGLELDVGEVSEAVHKGRHTTRVASLHPLSAGGWVADTPGIRELGTWQIPPEELGACFVEFRPYLGQCAFNDCLHHREPDCAVRAAVDRGNITESRYDSYLRMLTGDEERR
ncbi:MAG: ribosome small subunit-dependent GTPase A [Polyangiales bacterium]